MTGTDLAVTTTDEESAQEISRIIESNGGDPGLITKPGEFIAEVTGIIVATTAVLQALPPLIEAIRKLIDQGKVKKMTVGDVTVESPTADAAEQLLREQVTSDG